MAFKIIRNDITKMNTRAIVNTANEDCIVGSGCDYAIYQAAGMEELLAYRKEYVGIKREGESFLTPGFALPAEYIIHTVSPLYIDGESGEEEKLRSCYKSSLQLAKEMAFESIAFPLIATGSFAYPKEEGLRIAADEINAFLEENEMLVYLVVFDEDSTRLGRRMDLSLESYINQNYVDEQNLVEYSCNLPEGEGMHMAMPSMAPAPMARPSMAPSPMEPMARPSMASPAERKNKDKKKPLFGSIFAKKDARSAKTQAAWDESRAPAREERDECRTPAPEELSEEELIELHEQKINERISHMADSYSQYLCYLIQRKGLSNAQVYHKAIVDKKVFSKIKNNPDYHPNKMTALCLCVGAGLNLDETKDLLARAGYALSPCDKTDVIFSYFIENGIYDMIEIDIQLEEHGLPCVIA